MLIYILVAFSGILGIVAVQNLWVAIKPVKNGERREPDEVFSYGEGPFFAIGLFFAGAFWLSEKLVPERFRLIVFRFLAFCMAALLTGMIILLWKIDW